MFSAICDFPGFEFLEEYIIKNPSSGLFSCTLCGKENDRRYNVKKHVENIHFPGSLSHSCKYCDQVFTTRNNLNYHTSKYHRANKQF